MSCRRINSERLMKWDKGGGTHWLSSSPCLLCHLQMHSHGKPVHFMLDSFSMPHIHCRCSILSSHSSIIWQGSTTKDVMAYSACFFLSLSPPPPLPTIELEDKKRQSKGSFDKPPITFKLLPVVPRGVCWLEIMPYYILGTNRCSYRMCCYTPCVHIIRLGLLGQEKKKVPHRHTRTLRVDIMYYKWGYRPANIWIIMKITKAVIISNLVFKWLPPALLLLKVVLQ